MIHWTLYFGRRALRNIREEWALNLRVVLGFSLMLFVLGTFLLLGANLRSLIEHWGEQLQITAYLKKGLEEKKAREIARMVEALPEVEGADYIPESVALRRFRADLGSMAGVLDGLEENPLPASIEIRVPPGMRAGEEIGRIARQVGGLEGVEQVEYGQEWVERYQAVLGAVSALGAGLGAILLFVSWGSISNLIQLTVYARKDEIEILKLVGATNRFVRAPFLVEGIFQGLAASLLAVGFIFLLYRFTFGRLEARLGGFFGPSDLSFLSGGQVAALVAGSISVSVLAGLIATARHMRV